MSDTPRDTQFATFAKLLISEMVALHGYIDISGFWNDVDDEDVQEYRDIIARRAYDLVMHVIDHAPASVSDADDWHVPDMTEFPKETNNGNR